MNRRFGYLPIDSQRIYWFTTDEARPGKEYQGDAIEYLKSQFHNCRRPVVEIIHKTQLADTMRTDPFDLSQFYSWGRGCITSLGNAVHAMTSHLPQSVGQAIEDAVVLANRLDKASDVNTWLRSYECRRRHHTRWFVTEPRRFGFLAQGNNVITRLLRKRSLATIPSELNHSRMRRLLKFSA